jgi:hypothetical protein
METYGPIRFSPSLTSNPRVHRPNALPRLGIHLPSRPAEPPELAPESKAQVAAGLERAPAMPGASFVPKEIDHVSD